ncbi:MAG TPA: gamma-glutamyl-phosphate reductase, partial [Thioalkalivibrio sp.]|nr:gamma-glutamyl-phosphate reductase [Thioalkalivibrio sp.]
MLGLGQAARAASRTMAEADSGHKNRALGAIAEVIRGQQTELLDANARDLAEARTRGLDEAMLDRLTLTEARIEAMAEGCRQVAALPDPVG